ncbi:TMV resistance protein N [Arachis hypogaea]|uniref:TMV resistance protein N n=1 Tax=Arachis hypogaea TaxID=3818 RepID=UPI003B219632
MAHASFSRVSQMAYVIFVCLLLILKPKGVASSSENALKIKYDVFVSFRGPDIRRGFLSHLVDALSRKKINGFVDDKIEVGDEIPKSLIRAIKASLISLVIFSPNYSSSRWCLEELAKIVECREKEGQFVLPVFLDVDPSDVRHQRGSYGDAFIKHEKKYDLVKVQRWRTALQRAANLSGLHSTKYRNDYGLLEAIIKHLIKRLNHEQKYISRGLIGIGKSIALLESELNPELGDVRALGIWGMGGLGKTTLAWEVFNSVNSQYEGSCFLGNVRESSAREGIFSLKSKLYSELIGEPDLKIDSSNGLPPFLEKRLGRMKVIIVLDDVNDFRQLKILFGTREQFGPGSRIIVTSRDKQVLHTEVDFIYEVKPLQVDEALRLFNSIAFKHEHRDLEMEFHEQSKKVIEYAKGVPLVLEVLGHHVHGKGKEIWESLLEKLKNMPDKEVHNVMKLSYDDLDRHEKKIFLDIACFFKWLHVTEDYIKLLLKDEINSVAFVLERLKDKALITVSERTIVSMHDIIQETAYEIVRQESIEDPGKRSRLWGSNDIYQVLRGDKGSEAIRSISAKLPLLNKKLQLSPQVFAKMSNLHFLELLAPYTCPSYFPQDQMSLYFPEGLESLPNELRFLLWMHYPMEALPTQFSAENLQILSLPVNRVKKLWHQEQNLRSLKRVSLLCSNQLTESPDFSNATNLEVLNLGWSSKLIHVHPSVFFRGSHLYLALLLQPIICSLYLDGCTALKEFSVISMNMVKLYLDHTGIKQLPASIGIQSKLEVLSVANSTIEYLPESIKHLLRLRSLNLRDCRELQTLPELPPNIEDLNVEGCISLKTVLFPVTVAEQMKEERKKVALWNCVALDQHSLEAIGLNAQINILKFAHQHLSRLESDSYQDYDADGATYVYPGSRIPKWLLHRTIGDHITIDVPFGLPSNQLGFIFAFIVPKVASEGLFLNFSLSVGDDEDEGNSIKLRLPRPGQEIASDHVYLMYDVACSNYLSSKAKSQAQFKIKVSVASEYTPLLLKGLGVSLVIVAEYQSFVQQMKWLDTTSITRETDSYNCELRYQNCSLEFGKFYGTQCLFQQHVHALGAGQGGVY